MVSHCIARSARITGLLLASIMFFLASSSKAQPEPAEPPAAPDSTKPSEQQKPGQPTKAQAGDGTVTNAPGVTPPRAPQATDDSALNDTWCSRGDSSATYLVCIDLLHRTPSRIHPAATDASRIIQPNRTTLVQVRYPAGANVGVQMQGEHGLTQSTIRSVSTESAGTGQTTGTVFGPRRPGKANVVVTLENAGKTTTETVELLVEETYLGAIRVGIGAVFAGATDVGYEARSVGGASQTEIGMASGGVADFEIVLGAAPFLFDLLGDGPRPAITAGPRFAPYVGFGLVSLGADEDDGGVEVEFLKSIHAGFELEFAQSFSIAATFVIRRVDRLPDDLQIGSPITGDVPTVTTVGLGPGLVFNVSPDFLKLAAKGSGGLLD